MKEDRKKQRRIAIAAAIFLFALAGAYAAALFLDVPWRSCDGGGGTMSGGIYVLNGTSGQPDATRSAGGIYVLEGGFWASPAPLPSAAASHWRNLP